MFDSNKTEKKKKITTKLTTKYLVGLARFVIYIYL